LPHAFLVPHTHWDREWYLTFPRFRVQLTECVGEVLDRLESDPDLTHFVLDGQALALADHLEAVPEDRERIRALAEAGRLALGPWWILPDEFLVSGESTVRNLLLGHRACAEFGGAQKVGYLPDSFGHLAQMPQILRQAGIDSFVYTRGSGDEIEALGLEFHWEAPDGSRVLAVNQEGGYCNAAALGHAELWHAHTQRRREPEQAVAKVGALLQAMRERANTDVWLLNNGCDHHPPQREMGRMLAALREAFPDVTFTVGRFEDYLRELRASAGARDLKTWRGELLGGRRHPILSGVWSARIPLKQANARCQDLLACQLEPLAAAAHFLHGLPYPAGLIGMAWRELLKNHPHDSICGCSTDAVHRAMATRFAEVRDAAEHLLSCTLGALCPPFGPTGAEDRETLIAVANPLPVRRTEVVERLVVLQPLDYDLDRLALLGPGGRPVPFVVKSRRHVERFWGVDHRGEIRAEDQRARLQPYLDTFAGRILRNAPGAGDEIVDTFLELQFLARDLPACGHAVYRLTDEPDETGGIGATELVRCDAPTLENERLRVTLHPDGRIDLVDRASGQAWRGLNRLEDTEDAGDEYDWSPARHSRAVFADDTDGRVEATEDTGLAATLLTRFTLTLPAGLTPDRDRRRDETVACPVAVAVRLTSGAEHVDVTTRFTNRAEDHRLRAWFPTGLAAATVVSDGHFLLNERPAVPPRGDDWVQPHPGTYPQQEFTAATGADGRGLAVLARGLPEIAPRDERDGTVTLQMTLLRCVGWLSRDDFPSRRFTNAGPTLPTPEAQCPGAHEFRYALAPLGGQAAAGLPGLADPLAALAALRDVSQRWRNPVLTRQGVAAGAVPGGSLLEKSNPRVAVSAIKRHEDRDTLVVRLWNQTGQPQRERLRLGRPATAVWLLDLLEERQEPLRQADDVAVDLLPHRIVTLEIVFAEEKP